MNVILHKEEHAPRQRNHALLLTAAGAAILAAIPLNTASAEEIDAPAALLSDVTPVSDAELAENRGGFSIGNLNFNIGLTVTTAIQGANVNPISVTTNYSVDSPGHLANLGTQITNQVNNTLAQDGLTGRQGTSDASSQVASNITVTGGGASGSNPPSGNGPPNSNSPNGAPTQLAPPNPGDNGKLSFNVQADPQGNSISISNGAGSKIDVSTANGLLTTVANQLNDVTIQTKVDLNFAISNYHDVIQNAQTFQQAMSIAQQMLAIHGIAGH